MLIWLKKMLIFLSFYGKMEKIFRQIIYYLANSIVKTLFSRNFCQKSMRVNFRNFLFVLLKIVIVICSIFLHWRSWVDNFTKYLHVLLTQQRTKCVFRQYIITKLPIVYPKSLFVYSIFSSLSFQRRIFGIQGSSILLHQPCKCSLYITNDFIPFGSLFFRCIGLHWERNGPFFWSLLGHGQCGPSISSIWSFDGTP